MRAGLSLQLRRPCHAGPTDADPAQEAVDMLSVLSNFSRRLRRIVSRSLQPLVRRAARRYIAGPELADALLVAQQLQGTGIPTTLGFWDGPRHNPAEVQAEYLAGLQLIAEHGLDSYESIKFPALGCNHDWLDPVVASAVEHNVRLHFDSLADDVADVTWQAAIEARRAGAVVSCSVPGRWRRSRGDCLWAMEAGILVRVVEGWMRTIRAIRRSTRGPAF